MELPNRKSIRLKDYDYSKEGGYFITICTDNRKMLFGEVKEDKMILNNLGKVVESVWESLPDHHNVELDTFQIMPNHLHMIIIIVGATRGSPERMTEGRSRPAPTLGTIIGLFKSECSKQIRILMNNPQFSVWQRNFFEHVIRGEKDYEMISEYIINNPLLWDRDRNNPEAKKDLTAY